MTYRLHIAPQTCARVPLIALEEAGADVDLILVQLTKGDQKTPDFLALNPAGKVPVLETPDGTLTQNVAIARYLGAIFPALLPQTDDPFEDAKITADLAFCADTLHPILTRMRMPMRIAQGEKAQQSVREMAHAAMAPLAGVVDERLAKGPWWYADHWSIQDAYIYWVWFRMLSADYDPSGLQHWAAHAARMEQRPAVQRALAREAALVAQPES